MENLLLKFRIAHEDYPISEALYPCNFNFCNYNFAVDETSTEKEIEEYIATYERYKLNVKIKNIINTALQNHIILAFLTEPEDKNTIHFYIYKSLQRLFEDDKNKIFTITRYIRDKIMNYDNLTGEYYKAGLNLKLPREFYIHKDYLDSILNIHMNRIVSIKPIYNNEESFYKIKFDRLYYNLLTNKILTI
jgi:hypothetical protein